MGSSISGLEDLLRMPYGCGEQNMLNFAPNIYIMQYLEETNQESSAIKTKAIGFMKQGQCKVNLLRDHSLSPRNGYFYIFFVSI